MYSYTACKNWLRNWLIWKQKKRDSSKNSEQEATPVTKKKREKDLATIWQLSFFNSNIINQSLKKCEKSVYSYACCDAMSNLFPRRMEHIWKRYYMLNSRLLIAKERSGDSLLPLNCPFRHKPCVTPSRRRRFETRAGISRITPSLCTRVMLLADNIFPSLGVNAPASFESYA